jgi:hypothetical protein
MYIQIAPKCKVWISEEQYKFVKQHSKASFYNTDLPPNEVDMAKVLADKSIFVRKKIDNGVQYALNRRIRFVPNVIKK